MHSASTRATHPERERERERREAWKEYADPKDRKGDASREETAHKVAWSAVKKSYEKKGDRWVKAT